MIVFMGLDPGVTGAICSVSSDGSKMTISDFPLEGDSTKGRTKGTGKKIQAQGISNIIKTIADYNNVKIKDIKCYIEKSQAMVGDGGVSGFNYGVNYGILFAVLSMSGVTFSEITPRKWKTEFGLLNNKKLGIIKDKADSVYMAAEIFPSRKDFFMRESKRAKLGYVLNHGRSDAMLIAEYCRRSHDRA